MLPWHWAPTCFLKNSDVMEPEHRSFGHFMIPCNCVFIALLVPHSNIPSIASEMLVYTTLGQFTQYIC